MSDEVILKQSEGNVNLEETAFFFFGPPKIGKSTTASGWPNCLFLCTSEKEVKKLKVPYILVNSHEKLRNAIDEITSGKFKNKYKGIKTLVFDFVDAMYTNCQVHVCKKLRIDHASEAGYGKGVDMIDFEFKKVFNKAINSRFGCVFISHFQTKEVSTMHGTVTKVVSTLPERARKIIIPLVSVIGFIDYETVKIKTEEGKTKYKKKRVITFEPSEFLEAGDRDGYLPSKIPCFKNAKKTYELIEDYYTGRKTVDD